jgi:hypothetical protein
MRNKTLANHSTNPQGLLNPEKLWAIENGLIDIPLQYRDNFWNELLDSYTQDLTGTEYGIK